MTRATSPESLTAFRAVVEGVDRHGIRVGDEFQSFEYATAPRGLKLRGGEVVRLIRKSNQYEVQEVLPYQPVEYVRHPDVPGLRGTPQAPLDHPSMFSVRGRVYVRDGQPAHTAVHSWSFESADAEAAYLGSVLLGNPELPGVQLSAATVERLAQLGVTTENFKRVAEELQRVQAARQALTQEARTLAAEQAAARQDLARLTREREQAATHVADLSGKVQKAEADLQVFLTGIDEAEKEQARVVRENKGLLDEAQKERKRLLGEAQKEAKSLKGAAATLKKSAEEDAAALRRQAEETASALREEGIRARDASLGEARALAERAKGIRQLLDRQDDQGVARQELLGRQPYEASEEISALQAALQNLKSARGTTPEQLIALHVGLKHTPFTVLAGPSGSGKTSLVLAYAQQLGIHVTTVAVQPGWTSVQDLHGYVNPLRPGEYRSTPFFEALGYQVRQSQAARLSGASPEDASGSQRSPGAIPLDLVLLDEINLSHVEYFLADYLSAFELERRRVALTTPDEALRLALCEDGQAHDGHPLAWLRLLGGQLDVPRSFLIAGTANEDDTTRGFSDKFRDRSAFLHVEAPTLETAMLRRPKEVRDGKKYVPQLTWEAWLESGSGVAMSRELIDFSELLRAARLPVSVRLFQRTARMSSDARRLLEALEVPQAPRVALDLAVSLGIAHKYAQLTEGRTPDAQHKRRLFREALERLLAGRQQTTFAALGWGLEP
ncbi:hypothetical protein [Deinococcus sp. 23YEL01]|uniref:hypothetical protein n=1 Tax=Deinococcus sp. 23YEL01 TaxID=2745871 RepID=UPI001E64C852|nr:hypothetical protein [Deinococcus sp. 23YEL01]MCD0168605.1 hypothetical protein [Deinococcus sp. 23YEL01]